MHTSKDKSFSNWELEKLIDKEPYNRIVTNQTEKPDTTSSIAIEQAVAGNKFLKNSFIIDSTTKLPVIDFDKEKLIKEKTTNQNKKNKRKVSETSFYNPPYRYQKRYEPQTEKIEIYLKRKAKQKELRYKELSHSDISDGFESANSLNASK